MGNVHSHFEFAHLKGVWETCGRHRLMVESSMREMSMAARFSRVRDHINVDNFNPNRCLQNTLCSCYTFFSTFSCDMRDSFGINRRCYDAV